MGNNVEDFSIEQIEQGIIECRGNLTELAARMDVSRISLYNRIQLWPALGDAVESARQSLVDLAESRLWDRVESGDRLAIMFVLRTLGRSRGYGEGNPEESAIALVKALTAEMEKLREINRAKRVTHKSHGGNPAKSVPAIGDDGRGIAERNGASSPLNGSH